jgi:2-polyprenyl-3-methyl-5-hydroxy-6-metoxy-1,4-benzoquinol methylase
MNCRHCSEPLVTVFADLATCPPSNAMVVPERAGEPEQHYPLKVFVCQTCWLVQTDELEKADAIFNSEYTYFSSYSSSWVAHAKAYVEAITTRLGLNGSKKVVEIASNDGYLLQWFVEKGVPVLGVDPTANTAAAARERGVETVVEFFGRKLVSEVLLAKVGSADLILGNNVLAHVPDINDFVGGMKLLLAPTGTITMEFPHLMRLVIDAQFDTIYHEHFSYLSLTFVEKLFASQGLELYDVEEIGTHGGSLRIYARHAGGYAGAEDKSERLAGLLKTEIGRGMKSVGYYTGFQPRMERIKYDFIQFLLEQKKAGHTVVGYGAAAKGNTLLNYAGIKGTDLITCIADASPHKQNRMAPGSRIPVVAPETLKTIRPDYVIVFPWNLAEEIGRDLGYIREWGGKFVRFVPELLVY